jgi:hypothetical protein
MTPIRAQEIIQAAYDKCTCGPWSDQLDKVMTKEERQEVNAVWDTMPGDTCFVDAIYRIARTQDPSWNIRSSRTGPP